MDKTIKKGFYGDYKHIDIYRRIDKFNDYIHNCSHKVFKFEFEDGSCKWSPYINRWSPLYQKMVLAKFYQLKRHLDSNSAGYKLGMLTLNSYQDGFTDEEVLYRLLKGWDKMRQVINKMGYQYIKLFEPHKSGVPHMHIGIIGAEHLSIYQINRIKKYWTIKLGISSPDKDPKKKYKNKWDCIGFSYTMADETYYDKFKKSNEVSNLINYIISYMSKSVMANLNDKSFIRFHSLFWATGKRMWSTSADITKIMKIIKPERDSDSPEPPELLRIGIMEAKVKGLNGAEFCLLSDFKDIKKSIIYDSDPREANNVLKNLKKHNIDMDTYNLLLSKYNIKHIKYVDDFFKFNEEELRTEVAREYANQHLNNKIKDKTTITPYIKPYWDGFKRITYEDAIDHYHTKLKTKKRFSEDDLYL